MYYIYHIPGIKIGCTEDLDKRMKDQGFTEWEILETHEDGWLAGDREIELQKEYGYRVDTTHYQVVREKFTMSGKQHKEETKAKISTAHVGKVLSEETKERISIGGIGNQNAAGTIRTEENKRKISESLMGNVVPKETRSKISSTMKGRKQPIVICPHCNKSGGQNAMTRRHFDNCKQKKG